MAMKIGDITLPDIPVEVKSQYPYLVISKIAIKYDTLNKVEYGLFGSTVNVIHIPKAVSKKSYDGIVTSEPTLCRYKFIPEEMTSWTFEEREDRCKQLHNIVNESYSTANLIWTNHDINSATYYKDDPSGNELNDSVSYYDSMQFTVGTEVYFTKSIKFDGAWHSGIPVDVLETYPYVVVQKVTSSSGECGYVFRAANSPYIHVGRGIIDGSTDNIVLQVMGDDNTTALVSPNSSKNTYYSYNNDTNTWSKLLDSTIMTPVPIGNTIGDSGENLGYYELIWSNHDIYEATSYNHNTKEYAISNEIYFDSSYLIKTSDSHYKAIASKVREILGESTQYKPRELPDAIKSTLGILNRYDISTGVTFRNGETSIMGNILYPGVYVRNNKIITIPKHIVEIAPYALCNAAYDIEQLVFNEGLTKIGDFALFGLYHLTGELRLPESLNTIGEQAFRSGRFTSVIIPKNVTKIGQSAFNGCSDLEEVTILSDKIDELTWTFDYCKKLKRVDIKGNVSKIDSYTFSYCESLEALILRGSFTSLPYITAFQYSSIKNGTGYIYVPSTLLNQYKTTKAWSTYANQIRAIEDYPEICDPTE